MLKKYAFQIFAFMSSLYLIWRTATQVYAESSWTWVVFAIEVVSIIELGFITYALSHTSKQSRKRNMADVRNATAIVVADECSEDALRVSLYSLQESSEFKEVLVLSKNDSNESLQAVVDHFSKSKIVSNIELESAPEYVAWINAGDVVLGDMVSQTSAYISETTKLIIPKIALWTNSISNASEPQNIDPVTETVSEFISQKHGDVWAGQTAVFDSEFFATHIAAKCSAEDLFGQTNESLSNEGMKAIATNVIGVEQHDQSATARISTRVNETRIGLAGIFSSKSQNRLSSMRYATRPIRALRTLAIALITAVSVIAGVLPFPRENVVIFAVVAGFYFATTLLVRFSSNHSFDQISRVRHSLSNLGSDLTAWFTRKVEIAKYLNTFAGPALAFVVAGALVVRVVLNFGDKVAASNSASSIVFGLATLGVMLYGLELVGFRQRRNTLRRIVQVNAKFGRRAIEIADLSPNDCGVISNRMAEIGSEEVITLGIPTATGTKEISVHAKVVNSTKVGVNYRVGFIFDEISAEDREELTRFCTLTYPQYALRGVSTITGETSSKDVTISRPKKSVGTLSVLKNQSQRPLIRVAAILALFAVAAGNLPPYSGASAVTTTGAAKTISGVIFQDYNTNGVKDAGGSGSATDAVLAGVSVTATCDNSGVVTTGTATSNALGEYIINNVDGQCRVELTSGVPTGMKSSASGADSSSFVQFHRSGTANVMFGLQYPGEYCQQNPSIAVTCFGRGNTSVTAPNKGAILTNAWKSNSAYATTANYSQVGTVYGLAYKSDTKQLFSAAYLRRKASFGPMGIGGIYVTNTANGATSQWLNVETIASQNGETLGADPHSTDVNDRAANDYEAQRYVGRRGMGDIDVSSDNKTLFVTNLNTGSIYAIDIATKTLVKKFSISGSLTTSQGRTCAASDIRIFGLGVKPTGEVFVGAVCTAQSTQNRADLFYYVVKFDTKNNFAQKIVSSSSLDYYRDNTLNDYKDRTTSATALPFTQYYSTRVKWEPWQAVQRNVNIDAEVYPYASISDITFDGTDLVVGMRDIYSDTVPPNGVPNPTTGTANTWGSAHGDLIRLCGTTSTDTYILENNRSCGSGSTLRTAQSSVPQSKDVNCLPQGSGVTTDHDSWGPGGGEWFVGDDPCELYGEGSLGAIAKPAGFNEFAATQSDAAIYQGGLFGGTDTRWAAGTRWFDATKGTDTFSNVVYDPSQQDFTFSKAGGLGDLEALCNEAPLEIGNRVWIDLNGNGIQDPAESGVAGVNVDLVDGANNVIKTTTTNSAGEYLFKDVTKATALSVRINMQSVTGYVPTTANASSNSKDSIDSDGNVSGTYMVAAVPAHDAGDNDHTFDFGFKPVYALGNLVFEDLNNNGVKDGNETGIANVPVRLLNNAGAVTSSTQTDANGRYYFANLDAGNYSVEITAPAGLVTSTGTNASVTGPNEPAPSPNATPKKDNDDNGTQNLSVIKSSSITLGAGAITGEDQGATVNGPDNQNDYTVDFGLYRPATLGNYVWSDTNNDGIQTSGEPGVQGATVTLYQNACGAEGVVLATTSTDANGLYSFGNLAGGTYYVQFQVNGATYSQPLASGSTTANDSNANTSTGCTTAIALPYAGNDQTIDAGVTTPRVSLGNRVWLDSNNNGIDNSEPGIAGATVKLFSGQTEVGSTTTNSSGSYLFTNLVPGTYTVQVSAPNSGYRSTGPDATNPNNDTDRDDNGIGTGSVATSGNITLTANGEPTNESNIAGFTDSTSNANSNHSVDFGFVLPIDLQLVKSVGNTPAGGYLPGGTVQYSMTVTNNGPGTAKAGYKVSDTLPSQLSYVTSSVAGAGFDCAVSGKDLNCTSTGELAVGQSRTITFSATISGSLSSTTQSIRNIATVTPNADDITETRPLSFCDEVGGSNNTNEVCNNRDPEVITIQAGASLGNYVWYDLNHNGVQDTTENGVGNVTVELRDGSCNASVISTKTTDATGFYVFSELTPGKAYVVKFIAPNGNVITTQNVGSDATDSDASASTGCTAPVTLAAGEQNLSIDAGVYAPWASIGDYVWFDTDRDGIQDSGEAGISGVTVTLFDAAGVQVGNVDVTDSQGKYLFTNLEPGQYSIGFTLPSGYTISPKNAGSNTGQDSDADRATGKTVVTTLTPGENDLTWDLGLYPTVAALGDFVWFDDDNDGIQDSNEQPASGITVLLMNGACSVEQARTTTGSDGKYIFEDLTPGTYSVKFVTTGSASFTTPNVGTNNGRDSDAGANGCSAPVTLLPGERNLTIDAGIVLLASVGDYVWLDSDRDGIQDSEEIGIPGVIAVLLDGNGDPIPGRQITTDEDGFYLFTGLLPGTYSVGFIIETLPVEMQISPANQGNDDSKDTDVDPNTGITGEVTLRAGEQNITLDLGINPVPASLGDTVFEDKNKNGIQDSGDIGIVGVRVNLYDCDAELDSDPIDTILTGEDGFYEFVNLEPGSYYLFFETPAGMTKTIAYAGDDESIDSDVEQDGYTTCVDLPPGFDDPTIDAGFYTPDKPPVNVGGVVITKPKAGKLPFTGSQSSQLVAFAASLIGAGLLLVGFFTQRKKKVRFF